MNKGDALTAARSVLNARSAEWPRLERIYQAMRTPAEGVCRIPVPEGSPAALRRSAMMSETPYLELAVRTFRQVLKVDGVYLPSAPEKAPSWKFWQQNRMDAGQTGIVDAALKYGAAYASVLPGTSVPVIKRYSPRRMTAVYQDPIDDEWPMLALDVDGSMMRLFDETSVYYFGIENGPRSGFVSPEIQMSLLNLTYIETRHHDVGFCPVVRYSDQMLLDGEEQYGMVEPLLSLNDRIRETTFEMLVAQYFQAFKQRYIIGWTANDEAEKLKASAASLWTFKDPDVSVGSLPSGDVTQYTQSRSIAVKDLASLAQLPAQAMGVGEISNISAEALAGLEAAKDRRTSEMASTLGESHEQLLRLCSWISGDVQGADDYESEVRWKDFTARSYAQLVDGLTKIAQSLDVPLELIWEDLPGWSQTKVQRAQQLIAQGAPTAASLAAARSQAATVPPTP